MKTINSTWVANTEIEAHDKLSQSVLGFQRNGKEVFYKVTHGSFEGEFEILQAAVSDYFGQEAYLVRNSFHKASEEFQTYNVVAPFEYFAQSHLLGTIGINKSTFIQGI